MSFGLGNVFVGVQTAVVGLGAANTRGEPTPEITGIAVSEPATHPARLVLKLDMD